jgi:sodium-dependent dicarboxylate transporter 2/3/5
VALRLGDHRVNAVPEGSVGGDAGAVRPRRLAVALAIALLCGWSGRWLPFPAGTDPGPACRLLFVVGLTTSCWLLSAMPIAAASLLPLALLPLLGVQSTADLARGYGDPILWLFAGGFVLALAVERCGLHRRFALGVVAALGARPRRLVAGFFLAATCVSMWINNTAVALLLLPIGTVLVQRLRALGDLPPAAMRNFGAAVMCAIAFGASIGGIATPIGTAPNAIFFANYEPIVAAGARPVSFLAWMLAVGPFALLLALLASQVLVRIALPLPGKRLPHGDELLQEARALPAWTSAERRTAVLFGVAVVLWMTRGDLQLGSGEVVNGWAHYLVPAGQRDRFIADGSVAVLIAIVAFLVPSGMADRRALVDWQTVRTMPIDLLLLLGGGIAMADAFGPTGVSAAFGKALEPLLAALHPALFLLLMVLLVTLLSEIASNTAVATLLMPILAAGARSSGIEPLALMLPAVLAASCGFMLPIATPPNTIVFSSRLLTFGQMARAGICIDVLAAVLLLPVLWFWALPLLGVDPGALGAGR